MLTGRVNHERHLENIALAGLEGFPEVFFNYYDEAGGSQRTSKNNFLNCVKRFCVYLRDVKKLDINDEATWGKVTKRDIKDYIKSIRTKTNKDGETVTLAYKTLKDYLGAIDNFFDFLKGEGLVMTPPHLTDKERDGILVKEVKEHVVTAMTPEEVGHVRENIQNGSKMPARDVCIFMIGCRFGLRAQALSEIDMDDIDFDEKTLVVIEKNNKKRQIFLDKDTIRLIRACITEREKAFAGCKGEKKALFAKLYKGEVRRISKAYIGDMIGRYTADLDKHITPHKMRATCITNTYKMTKDIYATARRAGHSNLSNTKLYIDTEEEDRKLSDQIADLY